MAQLPGYPAAGTDSAGTDGSERYDVVLLGLDVPVEELDARIDARVELMWAQGFVAEVAGLVGWGLPAGRTASRALGYAQVLRMLDGEMPETAARTDTARATRKFARRQRAWFRRDPRVHWLPGPPEQATAVALAEVGPRPTRTLIT